MADEKNSSKGGESKKAKKKVKKSPDSKSSLEILGDLMDSLCDQR